MSVRRSAAPPPLRVLMLTEFFPASDAAEITGGVEARCFYVSRRLRNRVSISVIANRTNGRVWSPASLRSLGGRLLFALRALAVGLFAPADLVEATNQVVHPLGWLIARARRIPLVEWYADVLVDDWEAHFGSAGHVGRAVERLSLRLRADRYIAITEYVAEKLRRAGIPGDRISVIPCGHDAELTAQAAAEKDEPATGIVCVSRLVRYKGVHTVLDAVAALHADGRGEQLTVVGRGPELPGLRAQAEALGIASSVRFVGHLAGHLDVLRQVASARLLVSASLVEGFGIILVEAMALGVPYVASDIPAFREVTEGGLGGRLFRPGDVADLARAIADAMSDEDQRRRLGDEGRRLAARYRWEDVAVQTEAVWRETRSRPGGTDVRPILSAPGRGFRR